MTRAVHAFATISMDTMVNVHVISDQPRAQVEQAVQRGFAWFDTVEQICTRFDPASEVMRLIDSAGRPVRVSTLLLEAATFALSLAEQTDGAFDPTVGARLEQMGFDTNYKTGQRVHSATAVDRVSYRDVLIDRRAGTILLRQPLVLDLNAVVKGLAIDLAVAATSTRADATLAVRSGTSASSTRARTVFFPRARSASLMQLCALQAITSGAHPASMERATSSTRVPGGP